VRLEPFHMWDLTRLVERFEGVAGHSFRSLMGTCRDPASPGWSGLPRPTR
jgi:hypothetical protein